MAKSIFISYDGLMEPLGQSQILRYQERLAKEHQVFILSFEKPDDLADEGKFSAMKLHCENNGIIWIPLRYHKKPSAIATAYDVLNGIRVAGQFIKRHRIEIVHARSYVPSVIALQLKKKFGIKYIFDMRGYWADERVDGGLWPSGGWLYKLAKWYEKKFLLNADSVVSLTQNAIDDMQTFGYLKNKDMKFERITTCTDLDIFTLPTSAELERKHNDPFTLGYVGSVGTWYLFDETLKVFQTLLKKIPDAQFFIYNRGGHEFIKQRITALNVNPANIKIREGNHHEVAEAMKKMHAAVFFYKPTYSKKATAPTRLGEFLGCGVPCLVNEGVGDMTSIVLNNQVGISIDKFDDKTLKDAVDDLIALSRSKDISFKCRKVAEQDFSLDEGVASFSQIYKNINTLD